MAIEVITASFQRQNHQKKSKIIRFEKIALAFETALVRANSKRFDVKVEAEKAPFYRFKMVGLFRENSCGRCQDEFPCGN